MGKRLPGPTCRFSLWAFWFVRGLNIIRKEEAAIPDLAAFRRTVRPYRRRRHMALYLNRDDFQTGGLWAHFTGSRAWVAHFECPGGIDAFAFSARGLGRLPERIGFRIGNGQVDEVHKSWTVSRTDGMRALEHFLLRGERDPRLRWIEQPGDLWRPAEPAATLDRPRD